MILSFHIEYRTSWGEEVRVLGSIPELGNNQPGKAVPLQTVDGIHWTLDADIQAPENGIVQYSYHIYRDGKDTRTEWNSLPRTLYVSADKKKVYRLQDCWKNLPEQQYFYTSAFTESLLAHPERSAAPKSHKKGLVIKAYAPCIDNDHCLGICGNQKVLGDWDADKAVLMSDSNFPEWQVEVDASKISFPLEYKFILYNKKEHRAVAWENNPNRYMADPQIGANETLVIGDRYVYFALPDWKGAGVAVPIFSLRSEKSFGVGDFGDLRQMIDWAVLTHQKAVQILPINDTTMTHTWTDSYPYSSISIYAFHPMYADLKQMGTLKDKEKMAEFKKRWVYPETVDFTSEETIYQTDTLDNKAREILEKGGKVLIKAGKKVTYGKEVVQYFTPVFWNTSWFKMRPPHTTGILLNPHHPLFRKFPTEYHSNLQWWELLNRAPVMQFTDFGKDFQPLVQSIDTWFISRKIGVLFEANVLNGKLIMTTLDLDSAPEKRIVARQLKKSILDYMNSENFHPEQKVEIQQVQELFTKVAGSPMLYTKDSPDELKPKIK